MAGSKNEMAMVTVIVMARVRLTISAVCALDGHGGGRQREDAGDRCLNRDSDSDWPIAHANMLATTTITD